MGGRKFDTNSVIFRVEVANTEESPTNGLAFGGKVDKVLVHYCNYLWWKELFGGLKFIGRMLGGRVESGVQETRLFFPDCFVSFESG